MTWVEGPVTVEVPATSANLGPGYDCLGLALELCDTLVAEVAGEGLEVEVEGEAAAEVPRDGTHLVVRAMRAVWARLGLPEPPLRLHCTNRIPHSRGMGSSSAAIVGGLVLGRALVEGGPARCSDADLLRLATRIEGHPDNVAPALRGGLVVAVATDQHTGQGTGRDTGRTGTRTDDAAAGTSAGTSAGTPAGTPAGDSSGLQVGVVDVALDPRVSALVLVPPHGIRTDVARGLLPATVPHGEAAANTGRAALLVAALGSRADRAALLLGTEDFLHQAYRRPVMRESLAVVEQLRAAGLPAVVSGAGPTVLVLVVDDDRLPARDQHDLAARALPAGWRLLAQAAGGPGARVLA